MGKQIYYKHQYSDELLDGGKNRIAGITPSASGAFEAYASKGKRGGGIHVSCRGILRHHNTDIWGDCAPQDYHTSSTIWPMGGAWLCLHIYEHYQYTKDKGFLEEYFPILKDSVQFFMNYMVQNSDGKWVTGPSSSPENIYITAKNQYGCLCMGPTMDIEIVRELFSNYLKTVEILEKEEPLTGLVKTG